MPYTEGMNGASVSSVIRAFIFTRFLRVTLILSHILLVISFQFFTGSNSALITRPLS